MNTIISAVGIPILVLCTVPIFVILFLIILRTLRQIPLFDGNIAVVVALCAALLCMVGLHRTFVQSSTREAATANDPQPSLDFLLLPYTAMALAMLCVLLLLFIQKLTGHRGLTHLWADLAKRGKCADALRESPEPKRRDSVFCGPSRPHENDQRGPMEHSTHRKKIRTDFPNKETFK